MVNKGIYGSIHLSCFMSSQVSDAERRQKDRKETLQRFRDGRGIETDLEVFKELGTYR